METKASSMGDRFWKVESLNESSDFSSCIRDASHVTRVLDVRYRKMRARMSR